MLFLTLTGGLEGLSLRYWIFHQPISSGALFGMSLNLFLNLFFI
jgi:hypothetical protein